MTRLAGPGLRWLKVAAAAAHDAGKPVTVIEATRIAKLVRSQDDGPFARSHAFECDGIPQSLHLAIAISRRLPALLRGHQTPIDRPILYCGVTHGTCRERRRAGTKNCQDRNKMPHRRLPCLQPDAEVTSDHTGPCKQDFVPCDFVPCDFVPCDFVPCDFVPQGDKLSCGLRIFEFRAISAPPMADGSTSDSITSLIRSLKVGPKVVENVKGTIAPANGSLLLGQSFLGRFRSWSINNKTNELLLNE